MSDRVYQWAKTMVRDPYHTPTMVWSGTVSRAYGHHCIYVTFTSQWRQEIQRWSDLPKDTQLIISTTKIITLSSSFYFFTPFCETQLFLLTFFKFTDSSVISSNLLLSPFSELHSLIIVISFRISSWFFFKKIFYFFSKTFHLFHVLL